MDESAPRLTVVARRLDGKAPLVWNDWTFHAIEGERMFMVTGLDADLPSSGCWEIAAHYLGPRQPVQTLTYTVWVEP